MTFALSTAKGERILVDEEVYEWAKQYTWHLLRGYPSHIVMVQGRPNRRYMHAHLHHVVLKYCPPGMHRDHINRDKLDCRRENLRIVPPAINALNNSSTGAQFTKSGRWQATFWVQGKRRRFGIYDTEEEAIQAANEARQQFIRGERE
jgi:hypothetical protein